ncbi:MAG: CbtB-domain containing protein [Acidimicrobiales bacterium]
MPRVGLTGPATTVEPVSLRVPGDAGIGLVPAHLMPQENGALLATSWESLHKLFHDGRHAPAALCH